jgi:hypothetical protein
MFYRNTFDVWSAAPVAPNQKDFLERHSMPTRIPAQAFGGINLAIFGNNFRPEIRRVDIPAVSPKYTDHVEELFVSNATGRSAVGQVAHNFYMVASIFDKQIQLRMFDHRFREVAMSEDDRVLKSPYATDSVMGTPRSVSIIDIHDGCVVIWEQEFTEGGETYYSVFAQFYDATGHRRKRGTALLHTEPCEAQQNLGAFEITECFLRTGNCHESEGNIFLGDCPTHPANPQATIFPHGLIIVWRRSPRYIDYKIFRHSYEPVVVNAQGYEFKKEAMAEKTVAAYFYNKWEDVRCEVSDVFGNTYKVRLKRDRKNINTECGDEVDNKGRCVSMGGTNDDCLSIASPKIFVQNGDFILLANEADPADNGIYTYDSRCTAGGECHSNLDFLRRGTNFKGTNGEIEDYSKSRYRLGGDLHAYSQYQNGYNQFAHVFLTSSFTTSYMDLSRADTGCFILSDAGGNPIIQEGPILIDAEGNVIFLNNGCPPIFEEAGETVTQYVSPPPLEITVKDEKRLKEFLVKFEEDPECPDSLRLNSSNSSSPCRPDAFLGDRWNDTLGLDVIFETLNGYDDEVKRHEMLVNRLVQKTPEYATRRRFFHSCLLKEDGNTNAVDNDCVTTITRNREKGFVLEKTDNNNILIGEGLQQWKALGTNTFPVQCSDDGDYNISCKTLKRAIDSAVPSTPYRIQNQFLYLDEPVEGNASHAFAHEDKENGLFAAIWPTANSVRIIYHRLSKHDPQDKIVGNTTVPDKTGRVLSSNSPDNDGFVIAYVSDSKIVIRKFLWASKNESSPVHLNAPANVTIKLQFLSTLSQSYVLGWVATSTLHANHSKFNVMRIRDTTGSTKIEKILRHLPHLGGAISPSPQDASSSDPHVMAFDYNHSWYDNYVASHLAIRERRIVVVRSSKNMINGKHYVLLSNLQDSLCKCRFGAHSIFANYVSEAEVRCRVPESIKRLTTSETYEVKVGLTFNGIDYRDTGVTIVYHSNCDKGFFAPEQDLALRKDFCLPCPAGHFCKHVGQNRPEPCLPGTYQPTPGNDRCVKCPIGFYCPSMGMSAPLLCKIGFVCDTVGTTIPITPCPQGHYCLEGTATSLGDCCESGPALGHIITFPGGTLTNTDDQKRLVDSIKYWGDPNAMKELPAIEERMANSKTGHWPRWFPPLKAGKDDATDYTCGTGEGASGRPCCTCYKRPRKFGSESCYGALKDVTVTVEGTNVVKCAKPTTNATYSIASLATEAREGEDFTFDNENDGPCEYIYVVAGIIPINTLKEACIRPELDTFCRVEEHSRKVIGLTLQQTIYSCVSDHNGDEDMKQEGQMFARPLKLYSIKVVPQNTSGINGTTPAKRLVQGITLKKHGFSFKDLVEFNNVFKKTNVRQGIPEEIMDLEITKVINETCFQAHVPYSIPIKPGLNLSTAYVIPTRASRYDAVNVPEHNLGKRKGVFPEGFWRDAWIPVEGTHVIELGSTGHVRNFDSGFDYTEHLIEGWEVKLVDRDTGNPQVFIVGDGIFGANVITIEKKPFDRNKWLVPWWTEHMSPPSILPVKNGTMFKRYPGIADRTAPVVGRPLQCTSGAYCGTGVGEAASLPCTPENKVDGKCNLTPQPCAEGFKCNSGAKIPQGDNECSLRKFCASAVTIKDNAFKFANPQEICKLVTDAGNITNGYLRTSFFGTETGFNTTKCGQLTQENGCNTMTNGTVVLTKICEVAESSGDKSLLTCKDAHEDAFYCNCLLGHSCPTSGMREPTECSAGTFNDLNNRASCTPCLVGFMCPDSKTVFPKICPAGFICDTEGLVREQTLCSAGFVCLWGARTVLPRYDIEDDFIKCTNQTAREVLGRNKLSDGATVECDYRNSLGQSNLSKYVYNNINRGLGGTAINQKAASGRFTLMEDDDNPGSGVRAYGNALWNMTNGVSEQYQNYHELMVALNVPLTEYDQKFNPHYIENMYKIYPGSSETDPETGQALSKEEWYNRTMAKLETIYNSLTRLTFQYGYKEINGIMYYTKERQSSVNEITFEIQNELWALRAPVPCPTGYYCLSGIKDFTAITGTVIPDMYIASTVPALCLEGTYCLKGTNSPTGTGKCMRGFRCPAGIDTPISAGPGKFTLEAAGRREQMCFAGRYTRQPGRWFCSLCPKGFICNLESGTSPELNLAYRNDTTVCYKGFACDKKGQAAAPTKCPNGHFCPEGTASSTTSLQIALSPIEYSPTNKFDFVLVPGENVAVVTCRDPIDSDTEICDITSVLDRGDSFELAGETFQISTNTSLPFGAHCIMYGGATDINCDDVANESRTALKNILLLFPKLCSYMLKNCSEEWVDDFAFSKSFNPDGTLTTPHRFTDPEKRHFMTWPLQVIPLNRVHSFYNDSAPCNSSEVCIIQTNNGIMPEHNERLSGFLMGAKECKLEDTCANKLATGKKESSVLLRNENNSFATMSVDSWENSDENHTEHPYLLSAGGDKFQIRGRISNPKDYFTSSTDTEKLTDIGKLVKCQLLRMWGGKVILLQEPSPKYCRKIRPRKCKLLEKVYPDDPASCNGEGQYWPFNVSGQNTTIATLNFTEEKVVDYIEVGLRNRIELSMPPNYEINITDGNTTVLENMKIEPDTHMKGVLNAMRPLWMFCNDSAVDTAAECKGWRKIDPCTCGTDVKEILECTCTFPNSEKLDRAMYDRKHTNIMFEADEGYSINWGIGMKPILMLKGKTYVTKREPGLLYLEFEYANVRNATTSDMVSGIEVDNDDYIGKTGSEFTMSPPDLAMEWNIAQGAEFQSLDPKIFVAPCSLCTDPEQNHILRQHVMHIIEDSDFLNQTVQHENYTLRTLRSVALKINKNRLKAGQEFGIKFTGFRVYTRAKVYRSGLIEIAKRAAERDAETHFQQDIFPFPSSSDDKSSDEKCCAHPLACPEGTYCLRGVRTKNVDYSGEDFGAPLWCAAGSYCSIATASSSGSAACPAGFYCPPGTSIPRPCWKGFSCPGSGNQIPKICPAGQYSSAGPYPPRTPEKATSIEDADYKEYKFAPTSTSDLLPDTYLGQRRCIDYCCPLTDTDGIAVDPSTIVRDRLEFSVAPGVIGKCTLSTRCQTFDGKDYGCNEEIVFKGVLTAGAYDYEYYPDNETDGKSTWQHIPQPFNTMAYAQKLKDDGVIEHNLPEIIAKNKRPKGDSYYQSYSHQSGVGQGIQEYDTVSGEKQPPQSKDEVLNARKTTPGGRGGINWNEQTLDPEDLVQYDDALINGGLASSSLRHFSLEECPFDMIKDCDDICWHKSSCAMEYSDKPSVLNCSKLVGDGTCHDGIADPSKPNFNCFQFGCDELDCDGGCSDELMEKILDIPFTASCPFWHKSVHEGQKVGANMCGEKVTAKNNLDNDKGNDVEEGLLFVCQECSKFQNGPYQYPERSNPNLNFYSSNFASGTRYDPFDLKDDISQEENNAKATLAGLYSQKTGLWDEAKDGPAEIYFNPTREWWEVPVTSSKAMMFGCTEENIQANVPCARYFNLSKAKFIEYGHVAAYDHLKETLIKSASLSSGKWYEYLGTSKVEHKHGGGHPFAKSICAVHMELYEKWLHDTLSCAGTLANLETNLKYADDGVTVEDPSEIDSVYGIGGDLEEGKSAAWEDAMLEMNTADSFGTDMKSTYEALVYIAYYIANNRKDQGKSHQLASTPTEFLDDISNMTGVENLQGLSIIPKPMDNVHPNLDFFNEFYQEVHDKIPSDSARKHSVFQNFLTSGLINVSSYPKSFFGSHFYKNVNDKPADDNEFIKKKQFVPADPSNGGIRSCNDPSSKLLWTPDDFAKAVKSIDKRNLSSRIYRTMENCGVNDMGVRPKTIVSRWPYYPTLQGGARRNDLAENHKPNVVPGFYLEYDAGRRVSTYLYSVFRTDQEDASCGATGKTYYCGEKNRDEFDKESGSLKRSPNSCSDCCVGEMSCIGKARFTVSDYWYQPSVDRWINVRTPSNQTRYWVDTGKLALDYWHIPSGLNQEQEKKVICRFKLGEIYEPTQCTQGVEIGFHLRFVRDNCSLPLASTRVERNAFPKLTDDAVPVSNKNRPFNYMTEGERADGWHQSSSKCFKVFDYKDNITSTPGITRAYRYPLAVAAMDGLGKLSTTGTNTMREYDVRGKSVSIEMWIRPDNYSNAEGVLFETGDGIHTECTCAILGGSLDSFDASTCEDDESDLYTPWSLYQIGETNDAGRAGKMICNAGLGVLLVDGHVVAKLNPLFGNFFNVTAKLPKQKSDVDFVHVVVAVKMSVPWEYCKKKDWCGSHRFHRDIRLTIYLNGRVLASSVCYGCGAWTSLDAVGVGGSATGGFGFKYGPIENRSKDLHSFTGNDNGDKEMIDQRTKSEKDGDPVSRRRSAWECKECSDPLKIVMNTNNINGDWLSSGTVFTGYIALIRIYKKAFSVADAEQNYGAYTIAGGITLPYPPSCTGPKRESGNEHSIIMDGVKIANPGYAPYSCPRQDALYGSDDLLGHSKCQSCPDGYYCPKEGTIYPIQCPLGSYQAGLNAKGCEMCPTGTWSNKKKLANVFECSPCEDGHVCEIPGNRDMDVFALLPKTNFCPSGHFCMPGTTKATNTEFKCPPGTFCNFGTKPPDDFKSAGKWVARSQEIASHRAACNRYNKMYVPWDQAPWSVLSGEVMVTCMWKYSGTFQFRGVIGHYLYNGLIRQMSSIDAQSVGIATVRNKAPDQCHPSVTVSQQGCLEGIMMNEISPEDRKKGLKPSLFYGREFTHPDIVLRCSQNAQAGVFPSPEPMSPDKDTITDRYGKPPDNYHYRQFRWSKCVEDVTDKNDPMLKRIFQGLTDMQTLGHPWFDETVGQHVRDLYTYFKADYSHKTSLFFRQMPQAMIDYVTGECKRFQMQTAYEKWLGNNPAEKNGFPIYKKIIQPKDTTGFALPPRTLNERLYAPEPQDANKLDDDTETRGEFIAFEQLWMMNKPEKVVYNNGKQKTRKVTTNPADCRRFWANQFQDPELIPVGSKVFDNVKMLWEKHRAYAPGSAARKCILHRTGTRHNRAFHVNCPAWHGLPGQLRAESLETEFNLLPSMGNDMLFKELHQFHHETFPYSAKFESGPFYKCPSGYSCGEGTKSDDASRLDKSCSKGFFCPIGTPGPQPNRVLTEKIPGIECYKSRCRRPSARVTAQWGFTIGNNLANTEIVLNVSGLSKYDMDTQLYIPKPLQLSLGKICDPYDEIEIAAKMTGAIEALFANFAEIGVEDVRDTFELSLVVQKQCTCKVPPDQTAIKGECGSRQCLEWDNCVGEEEFPDASYSRKAEILNEMPLYRPLPSTAMYYITLVLGPYGIKCKKQNLKSCHEIEYGLTVNGDGNLQNRLNLDSSFLTFHALEDSTIVPLCASLDEDTFRKTWMRPTSLDETGSWDEFEGIDTSKCVLLRYRMGTFCLRPGCVGTELSNRARDKLLLCSTRHTMKVRDLQPGGSGRYFCASETCEARDQSGVTLPYEISEFECRMNWEDYVCPTGTVSAQSSLSPVDCLIDWSCASQNIPMYKNLFGNVGSAAIKVEDDPLPFDCPLRLNDVILLYEPKYEKGSTEPFARSSNELKTEMAKVYRISQVKSDSQLIFGDRWILGKWGYSAVYDGIQGFKKSLNVNRVPQIYLNTLRDCWTYTDVFKTAFENIPCATDPNGTATEQGLALSVVDPADFPYIYVPAMSHTTIEYNLLHMPLEMQPNVGFQFLFYTKELTRQRKIPSAALNPSSFEIKEAGAHQNMGLLHFTYTSTNATYIQVGAAILTGRFDRYYYHSLFVRTAKIYIDTPRRIRDAQPGIMADELEANWQFFAVLNRIDTDQADIKSILPMNLPLMMENGGTFSFLPQNNTEFCTSRFKNASRVNDSTRPGKADFCEGDYFGHYSIPVTNEFGTIFPSGVTYWRNGLQCEICHYDPGGVIEEGFWGEGGGLENCGKQFINFENPFAEEDGITFNKTRPYRVSHLQISDASRQMDLLFEPFQTFSTSSYLPYLSNCYRHGLKMSIFRLMEDPETCTFVKDRMLTAINPSDFFPMSLFQGHEGDKCDANITCIYDEFTTSVPGGIPEGSVFWFQKRERPLFYLTKRAQNISSMLRTLSSGTKGEDDWVPAREDVASELYAKRELVPVYVDIHDSTGSVQGDLQYMPRDVKFTIKYYTQVLPLGGTEKVIMLGKLSVGRYEKLTVEEECFSDCQYKRRRYFLHFTMEEMGLIEMINEYGLSTSAYLFLSAVIAGIIPVLVFLVWSNMRRKDKRNGNSNSTPNTAVMILAGMMNKKRAEFRKAKRVVANALRGSRKQFRQKESKKSEGELAESSEDLYDDITDAQIEKYFSNRLGISYEHNTFRSLQSRLNIHSAASKRLRTLRSNVSGPWAVYRKRFVAPAMSGFAMLVAFFGVGIGWAFLLYHKSMMGGAFTDLVPTNPALIRNIYELTLPRCIDRRARGEQIDAGNNCLTEYFINFNRGIRVATLLWMVGVMGIVISSNMLVYKPPRPQRQKRKVGEKVKKDVEFDASSEMRKIQTWKWFHYCNFAFVSQFVCLALIDSTSVPSFKKDPRIFWIILACVKSCRVIFDWLMKNVAEDELQASGLRVTCGVTEFLVTVTAAPNFISFVMATQLLLVLEILIIWKDSLLAETIEQLLSGTGIDRFELIGAGQTKTERRSYDVNLPNSVQQTKALKIVQNISILFASFLSYCMVLLLLLLFEDEYNRFNVKWQHVAVTLANVPFLPIVGFYLVDIEEMHGKHGMYIIMDWWAGVARGDVKRRFLWINEITRDISPALLEEKYDPKRKEPNILTLERSSCVFVPMCQKPNLELEEKYRELEKLGFTMRFFMGLFFQGFSTLLMTINMSGNMISWPTIDMVGMGMAVLSISFMKNIIRIGGPIVFKSLNLFISHKKYVEKKKSKFATSEKDKEALRRKTVADLCERLYMYRDEGKPDSQLVKVITARVRELVGDQIQKEDEIAKIIEDVAAEKAAKRSKRKKSRQKGNKLQIADVVPGVWPNELTHHKMV